jgi:membrane fusion protein (multidrug efflux system)
MSMQVVAVPATLQPVTEEISLVGSIAANEWVELKAEADGTVEEILFDEGQPVKKGQLLVRLDETKLTAAVQETEATFKLSEATFARARQLFQDKLISQQEFDQAAATFDVNRAMLELRRRQLKDARIYASFNGIAGARNISPGQVISRNTIITTLVDLDPVKVEVNVPERVLSRIQPGQKVDFTVNAYPGRKFTGEIYFIAPQLDMATRTTLVKTRIPNADFTLKGGMVANLDLALQTRASALVVPEAALISNGDQFFVFTVGTNQTAQLQPVTVGERMPGRAEITAGLKPGDLVVAEGHQKIGPGMPLTLAGAEKTTSYESPKANPTAAGTNTPAAH